MGRIMLAWLVLFCVGLPWTTQGEAAIRPNRVYLFEHQDYTGKQVYFDLPLTSRFKVVNSLGSFNDKASSIITGKDVAVVLFQHSKLGGSYTVVQGSVPHLKEVGFYIDGTGNWNDRISSLMVIPRDMSYKSQGPPYWQFNEYGVRVGGHNVRRFFPLPEHLAQHTARYPWVGGDLNDDAWYVDVGSKVRTTLHEHRNFRGKHLRLPGVVPKRTYFLKRHGFENKLSSLSVSSRVIPPGPRHRAPPAPDRADLGTGERSPGLPGAGQFVTKGPPPTPVPAPGILQTSGRWKSRKSGNIFQILQTGTNLSLLHGGNKIGSGNITGNSPSSTTLNLKIHKGPHQGTTLKGKPTVGKGNIAFKILWQPGNVIWDRLQN